MADKSTEQYILWLDQIERERDELRAENEQLRAFIGRVVSAYAVDEWIAEEGQRLLDGKF